MSRTAPRVKPMELRKKLLIAESEINRVRLQQEWCAMTVELYSVSARVKSVGSIASAAALFAATVSAFRHPKFDANGSKTSWFQTAMKSAEVIGSVWRMFRERKQ